MSMGIRMGAMCAALLFVGGSWLAVGGSENPAPKNGVTLSLFDGSTLQGWTVENEAEVTAKDGVLLLKGGDGWLRSDLQYRDFLLHVEWKALKENKYDAGIYVRAGAEGKPFPKVGHQVNLLEGKEGNIGNIPGAVTTGLVKHGDWNAFDILCVGDKVEVKVNGKEGYAVSGLKPVSGYVGLQCEVPLGGQFEFRNITITEIGFESLFNGHDLAGWEGAEAPATDCWTVEEGLLICTGKKGTWLRSAKEYGDFTLRFDYMVSEGGNSGVFVRVPQDGNHHRENDKAPPAGFEVQLLDDAAPQYKTLKDYQYSASVYDIAGAMPRVSKPAGQWNSIEIQCAGQHVTIQHNGQPVIDCSEEKHPLLKLRKTSGFLGLQNHNTLVKFRHVRIHAAK